MTHKLQFVCLHKNGYKNPSHPSELVYIKDSAYRLSCLRHLTFWWCSRLTFFALAHYSLSTLYPSPPQAARQWSKAKAADSRAKKTARPDSITIQCRWIWRRRGVRVTSMLGSEDIKEQRRQNVSDKLLASYRIRKKNALAHGRLLCAWWHRPLHSATPTVQLFLVVPFPELLFCFYQC